MADRILAKELVDYSKTDKLLEWQRLVPWINNFAQKKAKGVFNTPKAVKALADYLFRDTYGRYLSGGRNLSWGKGTPTVDASTKLLFGQMMLRVLTPRINATAIRMRKVGLVKGKLVKAHPSMR